MVEKFISAERLKKTLGNLERDSSNSYKSISGSEMLCCIIPKVIDNEPAADVVNKSELTAIAVQHFSLGAEIKAIRQFVDITAAAVTMLEKLAGMNINELIKCFAAGYTLEKPAPPSYDELKKYAEEKTPID